MSDRLDMLEERMAALEEEVARLHGSGAAARSASRPADWPRPQPSPWKAPVAPTSATPPISPAEPSAARFELDSETILKWGGVGLVVLAVAFLLSTAISRGWIGPELQLVGAVLLSGGLVATGLRLRPSRPAWTHALVSAGVAVATVTGASNLYRDQLSDPIGFATVAGVSVAALALARHIRSEWVGATAFAGGTIGWIVVGASRVDDVGFSPSDLAIWFAVLATVTVGLALERSWFGLRFVALAAAPLVLLGAAAESDTTAEQAIVSGAALLVVIAMFRIPSIGDRSSTWQRLEIALAMLTAPWTVGILDASEMIDDTTRLGAAALAIAAVFVAAAWVLRHMIHRTHAISLVVGSSVTLSIGVGLLLSIEAAYVGVAVQTLGLVVLDRELGGELWIRINAGVLAMLTTLYAIAATTAAWDDDAPIGDDAAHLAILILLAAAGWWTAEQQIRELTAVGALALLLDWLGSVLVHLPQGQAAVSASWAVVGTTVLVAGAIRKQQRFAGVGLAVLALTVAKLLTVDLRTVDTLWRAALFLVIGLGFLRLGFLLPRLTGGEARPDRGRARTWRSTRRSHRE